MSKLYDVIVIGASLEGLTFCKNFKTKVAESSIALVSKHFNLASNLNSLDDTVLVQQEVIHTSYSRGLFSISLADKTILYSKVLVVATGTEPIKSSLKTSVIQYNPLLLKPNKTAQLVIAGNTDEAVSSAIKLAKKFKYIYVCSNTLELQCNSKLLAKFNTFSNLLHLPNCNITGCKIDKQGHLIEISLDTYSTIKCAALLMFLGRIPDSSGISKRMVELESTGHIAVNKNNETTKVPNMFAIGACTTRPGTKNINLVIDTIIDRNKFKLKGEN